MSNEEWGWEKANEVTRKRRRGKGREREGEMERDSEQRKGEEGGLNICFLC